MIARLHGFSGLRHLATAAALGLAWSPVVGAQGVRITGTSSMQGVDLRPLVEDSVPVGQTTGTGAFRTMADGRLVRCVGDEPYCRFRSSGDRAMATPVVQDLRAVAWGFGQGISLQAHVRARGALGDSPSWPRSDDAFDAIEAWLEVDRGGVRTRLGRQWATGGLGVHNYDGASVLVRRGRARLEAFGGRSLVVGLNDPVTGAELGAIDDLPPDEDGWLLGLTAGAPLGTRGVASATWQRVIRADRGALYSERVAADASVRLMGASIDGSLAWDLGERQFNDALLRVSRPVARSTSMSLEARRHRPFFDAWTIWGAFSPVAFDELRATVGWRSADARWSVDARGARREYDDTDEGLESMPLESGGWRAGAGAEWIPRDQWLVYADYDIDIGFGASLNDMVAGARWMPDESRYLGIAASGLQHIYEFRVGTGRVTGLRVEGGTRLGTDVRLVADGAFYRHKLTQGAPSPDWSQRRFSLRLEWTVGRDPGAATGAGRVP